MRLKVRLVRGAGKPPVDLSVQVESSTTVGVLAGFLAKADPEARGNSNPALTLAASGANSAPFPPSTRVVDSGIRSGTEIVIVPVDSAPERSGFSGQAALVRVLEGPDAGKEFPVGLGSSVIGRDKGCEVRLTDPMVSRQHARLNITDIAEIVDLGSANGVLLGDESADRAVLGAGDSVRLGDSVISVVLVAPRSARGVESATIGFNRPPRVASRYQGVKMVAPEPPERPKAQRFPILPLFAPMLIGVALYLATRSLTTLLFIGLSPVMMLGSVIEQQLAGKRGYTSALQLFHSDLKDLVEEARAASETERDSRCAEYPSASECIDAAKRLTPTLWSRSPEMPGFLELRFGLGKLPSRNVVELPQGRQNDRSIWHELRDAVEPFATVDGVPVVADLAQEGVVGVGGPREDALGVMRALIIQLTSLHSPSDVAIAALAATARVSDWEWIKWLPHCGQAGSPLTVSPLASTITGSDAIVSDLERIVEERLGDQGGAKNKENPPTPALVLIVDDDGPYSRPRVTRLAERGRQAGVFVLWTASTVENLPAVCHAYLNVSRTDGGPAVGYVMAGEAVKPVIFESVPAATAEEVARILSPVVDLAAGDEGESNLPHSVSFLALAGTDLATSADAVLDRWRESRSLIRGPRAVPAAGRAGSLRALIGQGGAGPLVIDLRSQGPHALVGGTTGSGKSELLQTWILGMATSHSPQRVTFLLVDYKGGSAFSECVRLPHTVGLVTDLSPHLVRRALVSLSAELRYREELLHRKGAKDLIELERTGDPEAPPSLVIVVDEFAALVQEVPEFVDGVVNVAQRGRSLGLHLILATQRPAGVIKDNLRANTNLRLALRMADESDSTDVLGSPMAASFDPSAPGRAASRSGPSQFTLFQGAYSGGWTGEVPPEAGIAAETHGFGATQVWEVPHAEPTVRHDPGPTDIQRVVDTVRNASDEAQVGEPRKPWLPSLASVYDLAKLPNTRRDDALVFGVLDDPEHQRQPTIAFHPDVDGNLAVFGTGGSGKSTLLRTFAVAAGLTVRGGPCQVFGIDFGARGLSMLEELPHVGAVIPGNDQERVIRLLGMIRETIDERAVRYSRANAATITEYRATSGNTSEPRILLLLDGMAAFRSAYEGTELGRWYETFLGIAADGRPVGVHVLLAADRLGAIPVALASHVQRRIVLRMADGNDYSTLGVPADVLDRDSPPGRALIGEQEIQVAVLGGSSDTLIQGREIERIAVDMRRAKVPEAPPIERLSELVRLDSLPVYAEGGMAIGISGVTLGPVGISQSGAFVVAGPPGSGRTNALRSLIEAVRRSQGAARMFYFGSGRSVIGSLPYWAATATNPEEAMALARELLAYASAPASAERVAVFIEGVSDFVGSAADMSMQEMVKKLLSGDHFVVGEGDSTTLAGPFPLLVALRSSRTGIALVPEQSDGTIFRTQFPRLRRNDFPPGRGLLVLRGGQPVLVQTALVDDRSVDRVQEPV